MALHRLVGLRGGMVSIEAKVRERLLGLVESGRELSAGDAEWDQAQSPEQKSACVAWIGAAEHAVSLVCPSPLHPYRTATSRIVLASVTQTNIIHRRVRDFVALLRHVLADVDNGLGSGLNWSTT
jgi:hypothetical protein